MKKEFKNYSITEKWTSKDFKFHANVGQRGHPIHMLENTPTDCKMGFLLNMCKTHMLADKHLTKGAEKVGCLMEPIKLN